MAPYTRPSGAPSMGGIFNNFNSTQHNSTHSGQPHPVPGFFNGFPSRVQVRGLMARANDGDASTALIFAIVVPTFFVVVGLLAILNHAIKIRRVAKAKRAEIRAMRRARSGRSGRSGRSTRSGRSRTGSSRSSRPTRSHADFDDVPLDGPSPAYMASSRRSDRSEVSDFSDSLESPRTALHNSHPVALQLPDSWPGSPSQTIACQVGAIARVAINGNSLRRSFAAARAASKSQLFYASISLSAWCHRYWPTLPEFLSIVYCLHMCKDSWSILRVVTYDGNES
ncbi:hypothetical protein F503_03949 [Ophiostoma piceae UAMH 11346]|uniref:Uncharacterized protein n=1 Tax=Ophiostoma piceae (strain UAMH 11346) TaxID=1262450 RepID=S3BMC5_OPHP1|nr:hypothetical protein F503_03949 [Ophiostoma piceae UAMH 11346]